MLIANIEADELLNQCINNISKRTWIVKYKISGPTGLFGGMFEEGYILNNNKRNRDKRTLQKILTRMWLLEEIDYELELQTTYGELDTAIMTMTAKLGHIQTVTGCHMMNLWLGPTNGSNFRYKSATTLPYKGKRPPKPEVLTQLREWLIYCKGAQVIEGYEADDALGIYQTNETIAVHMDKDIFMIPGMHLNTMTDEILEVTEFGELTLNSGKVKGTGLCFFYYQLLVGDMTDNIPGLVKGKGPVWAYNLLKHSPDEKDLLATVITEYRIQLAKSGGDMSYMTRLMEQADLVWICRNREETGKDYIQRRYMELWGRQL